MPRVGDIIAKSLEFQGNGYREANAETLTADGSIGIKSGAVLLGSGDALAIDLADPVDDIDDGRVLIITAITAQAHVVTGATGYNGHATETLATFGGAIGDSVQLVAANGEWNVVSAKNVTISAPV